MPRRLLDIGLFRSYRTSMGGKTSIKLIEIDATTPRMPYVALSHRWGALGSTLTTEKKTLEDRKRGISFGRLGTGYQDAIHMLRFLGIQYVWIDSLCIIQDCVNDWAEQSQLMANIYHCAYLTLAIQNDDHHCGSITSLRSQLHKVCDTRVLIFARLTIPHLWEEGVSWSFQGYNTHVPPSCDFPLFSRGWIFQERLLSRRTLHITDRELSWICCQDSVCQCRTSLKSKSQDYLAEDEYIRWKQGLKQDFPQDIRSNQAAILWHRMVNEYTHLSLTVPTDRLVEIQGYASQIQEITGYHYIKGCWRESLVQDLLWFPDPPGPDPPPQRHPAFFNKPTWSWASVNYPVHYLQEATWMIMVCFLPNNEIVSDVIPRDSRIRLEGTLIPATLRVTNEVRGDASTYGRQKSCTSITIDDSVAVNLGISQLDVFMMWLDVGLRSTILPEIQFEVKLLRIGMFTGDGMTLLSIWILLWDYGNMIPGAGGNRQTADGLPIYQRLGLVELRSPLKEKNNFEDMWDEEKVENSIVVIE